MREKIVNAVVVCLVVAGALALMLLGTARSETQSRSTMGRNWAGNATGALTSVATLVGITAATGLGTCYITIVNKTATPVATGYTSATFPLTFANGTLVCTDSAVCVSDFIARNADSTALAVITGGGNVAVRIEVGGGCIQ